MPGNAYDGSAGPGGMEWGADDPAVSPLDDDGDFSFTEYEVDDSLDPLTRLKQYHAHEMSLQRLALARGLAHTAAVSGGAAAAAEMLPFVDGFAVDSEAQVRLAVAEELPALAEQLCPGGAEEEEVPEGVECTASLLLRLCVGLLVDPCPDTAAAAAAAVAPVCARVAPPRREAALLCPLSDLAQSGGDRHVEHRAAAAVACGAAAGLLAAELCATRVAGIAAELADDAAPAVRRAVAEQLGTGKLCEGAGPVAAVERVLPLFAKLCGDPYDQVRRVCAEGAAGVAAALPAAVREEHAAPLMVALLADADAGVRDTAHRCLGPFIHALSAGGACVEEGGAAQPLVEQYCTMADIGDDSPDAEYAEYFAFSLPAVAAALGEARWGELQPGFAAMYQDARWKVRRTLAYSLHEMARVVPADAVGGLLSHAFSVFLADVDDVRAGAVAHAAELLEHVRMEARDPFIRRLCYICRDKDTCWRQRAAIGQQVGELARLAPPHVVQHVVAPVAAGLLADGIAAVRRPALRGAAGVLARLAELGGGSHDEFLQTVLSLSDDSCWQRRQLYVYFCREAAEALAPVYFHHHLLPPLLRLARDAVPNVRLGAARAIGDPDAGLCAVPRYAAHAGLRNALRALEGDEDKDVAHFAARAGAPPSPPDPMQCDDDDSDGGGDTERGRKADNDGADAVPTEGKSESDSDGCSSGGLEEKAAKKQLPGLPHTPEIVA